MKVWKDVWRREGLAQELEQPQSIEQFYFGHRTVSSRRFITDTCASPGLRRSDAGRWLRVQTHLLLVLIMYKE